MKTRSIGLLASSGLLAGSLLLAAPAQAVTINPLISKGLSLDPQAVAAVDAAVQQVSSQFSNNVTTNILFIGFHDGPNNFLAESESGFATYTYSAYTAALAANAAANPGNVTLNTAVAHLGSGNGANDPNALIALTTVNARALGLNVGVGGDATPEFSSTGAFVGSGGTVDGLVLLNLDQSFSFTRPNPPFSDGVSYDAQTALEHEIDEVLGGGGSGSQLNNLNADPNNANGQLFGPLDLYRYSAPGTPSFDPSTVSITGCGAENTLFGGTPCSGSPSPYFSVDGGVTSIDTFNQAFPFIGGDAGDWGLNIATPCPGGGFGGTGDVQDAFTCNNSTAADVRPGTPSFEALESIGFDGAVPEPATWAMMILGSLGMGAALRSRRQAIAA